VPFSDGKGTPETDAGNRLYRQAIQQWEAVHGPAFPSDADRVHGVMTIVGTVLDGADVLDALVYLGQGDRKGAILAGAGAFPLGGILTLPGRLGRVTTKACRISSFDPGTKVLMADGSTKPIKDVAIGDRVLATDPRTGETRPEPVTDVTSSSGDKTMVRLSVRTAGGTGSVLATDTHPFWNVTTRSWTDAADLKAGDVVRDQRGTSTTVTATRSLARQQTVNNLTVGSLHTYYVLAGPTPVLVHNANSCSTFGFTNAPKVPGVYVITMKDGKVYVGGSSTNVHDRIHKAFTDKDAAVKRGGYRSGDVASIAVNDMSGHSWNAIRRQEQSVIDAYGGIKGGTLLNRRNELG
jgi:hypothetical protein